MNNDLYILIGAVIVLSSLIFIASKDRWTQALCTAIILCALLLGTSCKHPPGMLMRNSSTNQLPTNLVVNFVEVK